MFVERWLPLRAVADEGSPGGGAVEGGGDAGGAPEAPPPSGPGSGRSELRQQLEKNFDADRKATRRDGARKPAAVRRVAGGAEIEPEAGPAEGAGELVAPGEGEVAPEAAKPVVAAPEGFSAEAKAAWASTPPAVQAAIGKRITDMERGVQELKGRYSQIDQALAPHLDAIRSVNQSPPQAIAQLFGWFQALSANPKVAFPALVQSFNMRPEDVFEGLGQAAQGQPQPGEQPPGEIPPQLQQFINDQSTKIAQLEQAVTQKFGALENTFAQQSQAKTDEILANWSTGKPHFENVRHLMAHLIGSGAVPLKEGKVDLDRAYEMAIYADPNVRSQVLTAQQEEQKKQAATKAAAEKKAQQDAADKARRAAVSITGAAPGAPGAPLKGANAKQRKSVRESINDAMQQLQD
jgi:hypothetical protein